MTWDAFHRRGEVLRDVLAHAEAHRDGRLPMGLPGVAETFGDELTLLGALQLRWHTLLAGAIERELTGPAADLETAVTEAWVRTAADMPGLRAVLDACAEQPSSPELSQTLDTARRKDWTLMAAMAGKAGPADERAARIGREIEQRARAAYRPLPPSESDRPGRHAAAASRPSLVSRVKARLAA